MSYVDHLQAFPSAFVLAFHNTEDPYINHSYLEWLILLFVHMAVHSRFSQPRISPGSSGILE